MTEPTMKDLFQRTLTGEPPRLVVPDEDVARGRARQQRMRRNRVAGGVALLAVAGLGAAALPAVLDDDRDNVAAADGAGNPADYPPQIGDDPVKQRMWDAIEPALPADVEVIPAEDLEHEVVPATGPSIEVALIRGDEVSFDLAVTLEPARTDLPEFRPCSEPDLFDGVPGQWVNCEEGRDDDGVYRAGGDLNGLVASAVLAENDDVSATVRWNLHPFSLTTGSGQPAGDDPSTESALDRAEGEAIGDAVLAAAAGLDPADLTSGVELAAVAEEWPELTSVLEEAVGAELTAVGPEDPVVVLQDAEHQAGTVSAEYVTDDGLEVELWFSQRPRVSEPMCVERLAWCFAVTGGQPGMGSEHGVPGVQVGMRGDAWIHITPGIPDDGGVDANLGETIETLQELLTPLVQSPLDAG